MKAEKIILRDYRSITETDMYFGEGVNLIYGSNGAGKTNVLEAIYSYARGKSFRGATDRDLVRFGKRGYFTELTFSDARRRQVLTLAYEQKRRIKKINGMPTPRLSDMIGRFCAVMFCPEHLDIVKGGPGERREFLNVAISQTDSRYIADMAVCKSATEERNALLRRMQTAESESAKAELGYQLDVFSEQLADASVRVIQKRDVFLRHLAPYAQFFLDEMSRGAEKLEINYDCDVPTEIRHDSAAAKAHLMRLYDTGRAREVFMGATMYGVHRDDVELVMSGTDVRRFGSQGQQRSVSLALKLAEGEVFFEQRGEYPVYLFDDVLSELDSSRRAYLLSKIKGKQIILTGCDADEMLGVKGITLIRAFGCGDYGSRIK